MTKLTWRRPDDLELLMFTSENFTWYVPAGTSPSSFSSVSSQSSRASSWSSIAPYSASSPPSASGSSTSSSSSRGFLALVVVALSLLAIWIVLGIWWGSVTLAVCESS